MEVELEPRVKPLPFKVKAMSRESPAQKASHVLDPDLRNHWSTGTNTKEWILLELDEPCLLSHIRIYNKSVLEWEISVGLRYKPETFARARPRCEAPRREMMYPMNYTPCRYIRISCLRGSPIAIFFIQLIGISVTGLEPEFQPVVDYLLPHIVSHRQDTSDLHLQLLQDITTRLAPFLPQLEADLNGFSEAAEPGIRFLAMLVGQFYPILHLVKEREATRLAGNTSESETSRNNQMPTALTVSSNFEPRRSRNTSSLILPTSSYLVFRPDAIFMLLRKAHKDYNLGNVCRVASQILLKFMDPSSMKDVSQPLDSRSSLPDEGKKLDTLNPASFIDYSDIFGEEFRSPEHHWDSKVINVLDIALVEEGVLHVLYACASQPLLCSKFADNSSNFWSALPLVQALLPALRPNVNMADQIDDSFSQWKLPFVQQALSQIVGTSSSSLYRPLLHACAGYLSSFSPTHAKASCVLIDMCSGVLAPWMTQVIAKMDLTVELLEDLLAVIQGARHSFAQARAALKYIVLALSGHMDEVLSKYKDVKHRILFLIEMLEPYLDPAITPLQSTISFGNISSVFLEKQEHNCALALNVIRTAVRMPALLPSLEAEWRRGSVSPSVLLSVLEPHIQLPPDVNLRQFSVSCLPGSESSISPDSTAISNGSVASIPIILDGTDGKTDIDMSSKMDLPDEVSLLFAPPEINRMSLITASGSPKKMSLDSSRSSAKTKANPTEKDLGSQFLNAVPGASKTVECHYLQADYLQLVNHQECQLRSSEFRRLALDLHSQNEVNPESHDAAIDALLLAAECYVNPYFMMSFKDTPKVTSKMKSDRTSRNCEFGDLDIGFEVNENDLKTLIYLERKRDKIVLEIMLQAAELDRGYQQNCDGELPIPSAEENKVIELSEQDTQTADAVTLLRQNQALLCNFVIQRLQRDNYLQHEVLLQTLLFLLHSGTKLFCAPADIIEIILRSAEHLNRQLTSFYYQLKEGSSQLEEWKLQLIQRLWMLLQRLVVASSGCAEGLELSINVKSRFQFANLIPPSAWLDKIPTFSTSVSPLARFLGWMAISRNAIQYQKDRLFLVSDIEQLTHLLHVFSDELAAVDTISECKDGIRKTEESCLKQQDFGPSGIQHSFHIMYPDISHFFPTLKKQFETLGESILQAVALQLRSLPATTVPDLICWFSEFCSQPFIQNPKDQLSSQNNIDSVKGFAAKNAKAIVLYVLEAIVTEHMEAIVPEVPRVVQVLVSLCRSSYCDVSFLNSLMLLLKPIISYSLQKASDEERLMTDSVCLGFESLCFDELFGIIKSENESNSSVRGARGRCRALMVFVLASVFPDISSHCKIELLNASITSADFASFEQTTFFHDYLCAYQALMESCKVLIVDLLRFWGVIPCKISQFSNMDMAATNGDGSEFQCFLDDLYPNSIEPNGSYKNDNDVNNKCQLKIKEIESFSKNLDTLVSKLSQNVEQCYRIHRKLAKNLTQVCAECFLYLRCLSSIVEKFSVSGVTDEQSLPEPISLNEFSDHWKVGLEGLAEMVILLQEHHCWEVASMMLDCLFHVPQFFNLHDVIDKICSAIKTFSHGAPILAWRLQTDKWMSSLFARGINCLQEIEALIDLLRSMLCHPEPEQRFIALKQLGKLVRQDGSGGSVVVLPTLLDKVSSERASSVSEPAVLSALVSSTWDQVALLASSDTSLPLRIHAMALLVNYVPLVERPKLQSFLAAADCVLQCLTKLSQSMCEGPLTQLSIALFACVCLYSPAEDISLIPENLWRSIESFTVAGNEKIPMGPEKTVCQALCRLRKEGDEAKMVLKEAISSSSPKQVDPGFASTRETILEVITNLTSVQSYIDFFSKECDHKVLELEEAEIEMELLHKEKALQELANDFKDRHQLPLLSGYAKNDDRLQQIRDGIKSMEKARLREQIVARRQKKLLTRRARQTYLEEAAMQEAQLLQELDRERTAEVEREIERQRLLELEHAKTRELRHNLDLEKEKQTQRELQRELEQVESGLRPSRREFSSTHTSSRPRERYRERENGRAVNEGTLKAGTGAGQPETVSTSSSTAAMPTVMLSGARQFLSQLPTILQSRDRSDEGGNSYDDNFDGSRDSGDTGSIGDADIASALDGVSMNFGPSQKHGSRGGGKSRQIMERRDRDGRREGKWERKH